MPSSFLDPSPPTSVLAEFAPPGPAVYRREWCRLEEEGAVEFRDPTAFPPGVHRVQVEAREDGSSWAVGLGGRRVQLSASHPSWAEVRIRVSPPEKQHFVTPCSYHVVGSAQTGWTAYTSRDDARAAAGASRVDLLPAQ